MALQDAGEAARGADLYVTLEPCAHAGRTGPCTRAIIAAGVRRVAAAMQDPNPLVAGKGFRALRRAGIPVVRGMMEEEARSLNRSYCRWVVSGRPFVTLKLAISLDGQVASASGESRWISGDPARKIVHRMRSETDAVLVGGETYRQDAPQLTARVRGGRNPGRVDALGREGITSLLAEGEGKTAGWLVEAGAVDRYVFFLAPLLLGEGVRSIAGFAAGRMKEGRRLLITSVKRAGSDIMVVAEPASAV
jgi:riboflavin biosynthesis pyrimidine reductase